MIDRNDIILLQEILPWVLFLSFFRGFVVLFTGNLVTTLNINILLALSFLPLVALLFNFQKFNQMMVLVMLIWYLGGLTENVFVKLMLIYLGMVLLLSLLASSSSRRLNIDRNQVLWIFAGDYLLRSPNLGQDFIFNSSELSKFVTLAIVFATVYLLLTFKYNERDTNAENQKLSSKSPLIMFLVLFVYLFDFSSAGVLTLAFGIPDQQAHLIQTGVILLLLSLKNIFDFELNAGIHFILIGLLLSLSAYFFPFYGISYSFWIIGLIAMYTLAQDVAFKNESYSVLKGKSAVGIGYSLFILFTFYGLLTESYLLVPFVAVLIGVIQAIRVRDKGGSTRFRYNFSIKNPFNIRKQGISIGFLVFIMLTTLIPPSLPEHQTPPSALRVMTYNLHFGISDDGTDNIDEIVQAIKEETPTIIAFQEVTLTSITNGNRDMFSALKIRLANLGLEYSYVSQGGKYAGRNAFFSAFPILNEQTWTITPRVVYERSLIGITVDINDTRIRVFNSHVTHVEEKNSNPDRVSQIQSIMATIQNFGNTLPIMLLGDFNAEPSWEEIDKITTEFQDSWIINSNNEEGLTWPSDAPRQRIDYIFVSDDFNVRKCELKISDASDHLPVICDLAI